MGISQILFGSGIKQSDPSGEIEKHEIERYEFASPTEEYLQPVELYSEMEIAEACYQGKDPLLRFYGKAPGGEMSWVLDIGHIGNRKVLCHMIVQQMLRLAEWMRDKLELSYGFKAIREISSIDFEDEIQKGLLTFEQARKYRSLYVKEAITLVNALEQALTLIYNNPILREMLKAHRSFGIDEADLLKFQVEVGQELPIIFENHSDGFRGSKRNHGSLFVREDGHIELRMDLQGKKDIRELVHEYAAFLILKKVNGGSPYIRGKLTLKGFRSANELLQKAKNKNLQYLLIIIDFLAQRHVLKQLLI